jgi:hypothetical protein
MPQARTWTNEADAAIRMMRSDGQTWAAIGRSLGLSRNTVIERGRRLRTLAPPRQINQPVEKKPSEDPNRPPLEAGHKLTWGLLTSEEFPGYKDNQRLNGPGCCVVRRADKPSSGIGFGQAGCADAPRREGDGSIKKQSLVAYAKFRSG